MRLEKLGENAKKITGNMEIQLFHMCAKTASVKLLCLQRGYISLFCRPVEKKKTSLDFSFIPLTGSCWQVSDYIELD